MKHAIATACLSVLVLAGCRGAGDDQETGSISADQVRNERSDLPTAVVAALDSGNAAYRANDYQAALQQYRKVVELEHDLAAGWFGVYMAQLALGNTEAADSAMNVAQQLAPGASLIHPDQSPQQ